MCVFPVTGTSSFLITHVQSAYNGIETLCMRQTDIGRLNTKAYHLPLLIPYFVLMFTASGSEQHVVLDTSTVMEMKAEGKVQELFNTLTTRICAFLSQQLVGEITDTTAGDVKLLHLIGF